MSDLSNFTDDQLESELARREMERDRRDNEVYQGLRDDTDTESVDTMMGVDKFWS